MVIQSNKKLTDTNNKINKLQAEIVTFEQLIVSRSVEFEAKLKKSQDEYSKQKQNLLQERNANEEFEKQLAAKDEQELAKLANLDDIDREIQSMEIEIAKKTREMKQRVIYLKLMKQIKLLDETHQAAMNIAKEEYEQKEKDCELNQEIAKTQKHIVDTLDELA